jgi:hypothetical protein
MPFGRRAITHEFPKRDKPYTEDMGRRAREYRFEAYFLGDNYLSERDRLLEAIEKNDTPGTLVHPTLGDILAKPTECRLHYTELDGGIEYLELVFVEAGEPRYPNQQRDTQALVKSSGGDALEAIQRVFTGSFRTASLPEFVTEDARIVGVNTVRQLREVVERLNTGEPEPMAELEEEAEKLKTDLQAPVPQVLRQPELFAARVIALFLSINLIFRNPTDAFRAFKRLSRYGDGWTPILETTTTRRQQARNRREQIALARRTALIGMAQTAADIDFDSYDDAVSLRDDLADRLDAELLAMGDTGEDDALVSMEALRAKMVEDLTVRGGNLERVKRVRFARNLPALVASYDVYETANRDGEVIRRNRIRHPGFCPDELEVLV